MKLPPLPTAAALLVALVLSATAARADDPDLKIAKSPTTNPWTSLEINNDPANFQFVIVADRTGGARPGIFEDAVKKVNLLRPEFVMSVGDLIQGYTRDQQELERQWKEFQSFTAQLKMPFFYVPGNHDLSNDVQVAEWHKRFGRSYYHFVYRNVLFLCLNSEDPPQSHISDEQVSYVRKALEENKDVRWTLVFMHKPLWTIEDRNARTPEEEEPTGWLKVEDLLRGDGRDYTVFAGHNHNYMKFERQDRRYIILATTGGGSRLRGTGFGEFDHVVWATMTDEGPVLANLLLAGIWDEDVTTEQSKSLANALNAAAKVVAEPLRPEGDAFTGATIPLRLTNDADLPLKVSGRFRPSEQVRPDPHAIERTIEPNSVEIIDLKLDTRGESIPTGDVAPLLLDLALSYDVPEGPALEIQRLQSVAIDRVSPVARAASAVTVDGRLDEWKELPFATSPASQIRGDSASWQGAGDASFRFATAYDEEFVYVAVDAIDENVIRPTNPDRPWLQDSVEIRLDARPDPVRSQNRGQNEITDFIFMAVGPGATDDETSVFPPQRRRLPEGTKYASVKTPKGFAVEVAIPTKYLDERQKAAWREFRLNVFQNDRDEPTGPHAQINWRPDWRTDESYAGSGTFRKE